MEAAPNVRVGSLPMSSSSRKDWHAVPEHHPVRSSANEEVERTKSGQSDVRTLYEQERKPLDGGFYSLTIDGNMDDEVLQQNVHSIARQRAELQEMEIELRAQLIARSEIMDIQNRFNVQIKEHANTAVELKEQLHEREQTIHELERKMEEIDRELRATKRDNEAAWAKEDLLREQNKELATFRRERDHSEAERNQNIQQIHDLQQHIQEKERQLMDMQEQHRVAQETIIYKDEQLREAHAWIARVQEMEVLQSTSVQAELRERTEQLNQLWHGCHRQFAEMERLHTHTVQQLHLELANARERNGSYSDEQHISQTNSNVISHYGQNNGNQLDVNGGGTSSGTMAVLSNGSSDNVPSLASSANATQIDHVPGVQLTPSSLFGMPTYFPPGQVTAVHPFVMHQQGIPHSLPLQVPESHVGHFQSVPPVALQQWQNQQVVPEGSHMSMDNHPPSSQNEEGASRPPYDYEISADGQTCRSEYLDVHTSQGIEPEFPISLSSGEEQVSESIDRNHQAGPQSDQGLQQISSKFHDALSLDLIQQNREPKEQQVVTLIDHGVENHGLTVERPSSAAKQLPSDQSFHSVNPGDTTIKNATAAIFPEANVSTGKTNSLAAGKIPESILLDERSLLACIVRTIPAGGRIRISSTLPNRLGKMLAPLYWHDYKKSFGKLDDFVASHPELFVIEEDYIQLREGAQEMIAATAAVAKVAAAAAVSSSLSSFLPSVAVTPMSQAHRVKRVSNDSRHVTSVNSGFTSNTTDNLSQPSAKHNQISNGAYSNATGSLSNIKILSKPKNGSELNGLETRSSQSPVLPTVGSSPVRTSVGSDWNKRTANGRSGSNLAGKQQGREVVATTTSRR